MKTLLCILTTFALAGIAPSVASAADLGRDYYEESEAYVERPVPPVRVERRYYEPDYYYDDRADRNVLSPPVSVLLLPAFTLTGARVAATGVAVGVMVVGGIAAGDTAAAGELPEELWRPRRDFEHATYGLGNRCSIQLSYGAKPRRRLITGAASAKTMRST